MLRLNQGNAHAYFDDIPMARQRFSEAETEAARLELDGLAAMAAHNLGFAEGRAGRLAEGLLALDCAAATYERVAARVRHLPVLYSDRAEILRLAGLAGDACVAAQQAVDELASSSNVADLTEANLLLARALLANSEPRAARETALRAAAGFRLTRRRAWVAQAAFVVLQADFELSPTSRMVRLGGRLERHADQLIGFGWPVDARDALAYAALAALAGGQSGEAARLVRRASAVKVNGGVEGRLRLAYAKAALLAAQGNRAESLRLLANAITGTQRTVANTASTEARFHVLRYAAHAAALGVHIAFADGRPSVILHWSERQRLAATTIPNSMPG